MSPFAYSLFSLLALNAAALSNWIVSELYFRRGSLVDLSLALAFNVLAVVLPAAGVRKLFGETTAVAALRFLVLFCAAYLATRFTISLLAIEATATPVIRLVVALLLALLTMKLISPPLWERVARATAVAALAFAVAPSIWRSIASPDLDWSPVAAQSETVTQMPRNKVVLLLDELGDTAAEPIADRLRQLKLNVTTQSLTPAGQNTLNVIPAMFSGRSFDQARPCGRSSICSDANVLDFSKIRASRRDIDVIGLQHPYCDIKGLRYCAVPDLPHEHGNVYRALANVYLSRIKRSPEEGVNETGSEGWPQSGIVQQQLAALRAAPFWKSGGVLYAHLALPHPPGVDGLHTLDVDYHDNIEKAAQLVQETVQKLQATFGDDFALLITSDHPLRAYWCASAYYRGSDCTVRPAYNAKQVPLIIASPRTVAPLKIESNRDLFGKL